MKGWRIHLLHFYHSSARSPLLLHNYHHHRCITMDRWWEAVYEGRDRILHLSSILSSSSTPSSSSSSFSLSSLAYLDDPAKSLLSSFDAYSVMKSALSSSLSDSSFDPLCRWLCETFSSSVPELRLFSLSFLPTISNLYLSRSITDVPSAPDGFKSFLLALYNSQVQTQNAEPQSISIADLSKDSIYHTASDFELTRQNRLASSSAKKFDGSSSSLGVKQQSSWNETALPNPEHVLIVGGAFDCYYKHIANIPSWSKIEFCQVVATWAGECRDCEGNGSDEVVDIVKEMGNLEIKGKNKTKFECETEESRILLPWELLQPMLRIVGHCLMSPFCPQEVKDAASVAVKRLYTRATHELDPQAIMATRNLFRLDERGREEVARRAAELLLGRNVWSTKSYQLPEPPKRNLLRGLPEDEPMEF